MTFKAILIEKAEQGPRAAVRELDEAQLPDGDVLVRVEASTLNYKDALAITGTSPVVRSFPMVAGIDFAGSVEHSEHPRWRHGDRVILNGWGLGETRWGGLSQLARVKGDWLVGLPEGFNAAQAMAIGTAGYTAMLCVLALERHGLKPGDGDVLVTGANGGVGTVAIALLGRLGYRVVASTGRLQEAEFLRSLGAADVMDRAELAAPSRPLGKERWAGAIDVAGGHTLANVCAGLRYGGAVAACGLAQGMEFPATVAPFILRGVTLYGIDSVMAPLARREEAWRRLRQDLDTDKLASLSSTVDIEQAMTLAPQLLAGQVRGRLIVDLGASS